MYRYFLNSRHCNLLSKIKNVYIIFVIIIVASMVVCPQFSIATCCTPIINAMPEQLSENTLDDAIVLLAIQNETNFQKTNLSYYGTDNSAITVKNVSKITEKVVKVVLGYNNDQSHLDSDTIIHLIIKPGALTGNYNSSVTSSPITVSAVQQVSGLGSYYSTGDATVTNIEMGGYSSISNMIYVYSDLAVKNPPRSGKAIQFQYIISIYNSDNTLIGRNGSYADPKTIKSTQASPSTASIVGEKVKLSKPLNTGFRIVVCIVKTTEVSF